MTSPRGPSDPVREQQSLVRELHDEIAQLLCRAFLQARGHAADPDAERLQGAMRDLAGTISSALDELRTLDHLRLPDHPAVSGESASEQLVPRRVPTVAAAAWTAALQASDIDAHIDIPTRADQLAVTVQGTILRTLDVVGGTATTRGRAGTRCSVTMTIETTHVALQATMRDLEASVPSDPTGSDDVTAALARTVAELEHRVRLLEGTLTVGSGDPGTATQWNLLLTLPRVGHSIQD